MGAGGYVWLGIAAIAVASGVALHRLLNRREVENGTDVVPGAQRGSPQPSPSAGGRGWPDGDERRSAVHHLIA